VLQDFLNFRLFQGFFLLSGDVLVNDLLLPIGLLMLSVVQYRVSNSREFFQWRPNSTYYWPQWTRQIAGGLQIGFLLIVPFIGLVQMYRYLTKGPPDILDVS
jgi:solute carrier family 6 (neurotransmitter transporter), invertebrate